MEGRRGRGSKRSWTQAEKDRQMDPGNFIQYVHVDDELLSGDDRLVRDMVHKLKTKVPREEG